MKEISDYHGGGLTSGPYNDTPNILAGPRGVLATEENADALCQWSGPQGYWACGWSNQYDWAFANLTSFAFTPAGCVSECFQDATNPNAVFFGDENDPLYIFNIAQPVNLYDGTLEGIEIAVQHLFENNFGVLANATFIGGDTDANPAALGEQFALPGFGDAANFSVFYEDEKLRARLSYNYKAETFTGMDQYNPLYIAARGQIDFTTTYTVSENTQVFLEAVNIGDSDVELYSRYKDMTFLYQDHGPIYKAGFRVSF